MMDNLFKEFENKKFQALPYEKKKEIVGVWTDANFAVDNRYKNADAELKAKIKDTLAHRVIDFKVGDIPARTEQFFTDENAPASPTEKVKPTTTTQDDNFHWRDNKNSDGIVDTALDWGDDMAHGASVGIDKYGASINKALDFILPKAVSDFVGLKGNQDFWNERKKLHEAQIDNKVAGLAGEIVGDPLNFTPMGIAEKGSKLARVAQSAGAGIAIGAGTTAAKNIGDEDKTSSQKVGEDIFGATIVGTLNAIIAGVTKGRVVDAIKDVPKELKGDPVKAEEAVQADIKNSDLTEEEAQQVADKVTALKKNEEPVLTPDAKETTDEFLNRTAHPTVSEELGIKDSVIPQELPKVDEVLQKDEEGWSKLFEDVNGAKPKEEPQAKPQETQEPVQKKELPLQQQLQQAQSDKAQSLRKAEFEKSVDNIAGADAHYADAQKHDENIVSTK